MTLWKVEFNKSFRNRRDEKEWRQFAARTFNDLTDGLRKYIEGQKFENLRVVAIQESGDVEIIGD